MARRAHRHIIIVLSLLVGVGGWIASVQSAWSDIYVSETNGVLTFTDRPTKRGFKIYLIRRAFRAFRGKESADYDRLIASACQNHGVEFALVKALIKAESAFDPSAISRAGAQGLMQLMPQTAELHQVKDAYAPEDNIGGGVRHLRMLLDRFGGDLTLTLAAYNAGAEAVKRYNGVPPYRETQDYVQRVLQYREQYVAQYGDSPVVSAQHALLR